jgi:two-component system OmpR family sensor kinase
MYGESKRLGKLVGDLLLLAKLDREPELNAMPADIGEIIREMEPQLRLLAQQRNVRFDMQPLPLIPLDRDKIKQVVLNLFHNAVQHTDPHQGRIALGVNLSGNSVYLTVADNGSGIPPEHLPRIFDRFYRLDESRSRIHGGTGIGLSISRSIVELHGGTIEAESIPGEGSVFRVILPLQWNAGDPVKRETPADVPASLPPGLDAARRHSTP